MKAQPTANTTHPLTTQAAQQRDHSQFGECSRRDVAYDISTGDPLIINNLQLIINTAAQHHSDACVAVTFGESFVSQRLAGAPARYTFSAKEKDSETGYSYFGARYYESGLSIWLSVDPLADKYPSLSSYVYCANNPVILVDPDGRDIWEIDESGNILKHTVTDKFDQFRVIDANGEVKEGKKYTYGTVVAHNHPDDEYGRLDLFRISGDENAKEVFELFADNTNVEWTHAKIGTEESGRNIVGTSHSPDFTSVGKYLRDNGYTLREVNHNHPSGIPIPSGRVHSGEKRTRDLRGAELYNPGNSNKVELNIYTRKYRYASYNKNGTTDTRFGYIPPVIVTPKK